MPWRHFSGRTGKSHRCPAWIWLAMMIHPDLDAFTDPAERQRWRESRDWQLFRNKAAYPRAWVVHRARVFEPIDGRDAPILRANRAMRARPSARGRIGWSSPTSRRRSAWDWGFRWSEGWFWSCWGSGPRAGAQSLDRARTMN